jgi:hypothetical protein
LIQKTFTADTYKAGLEQATAVVAMYQEQFPEAMMCLATELAECLTALRFPEPHRKRFYLAHLCLSWDKAIIRLPPRAADSLLFSQRPARRKSVFACHAEPSTALGSMG